MCLTDLIKALTDVLAEVGDCDVVMTTECETKAYDTVLLHIVPVHLLDTEENEEDTTLMLRMEAVEDKGGNYDTESK